MEKWLWVGGISKCYSSSSHIKILYIHSLLLFLEMEQSGSLITAESKVLRNFGNTEVHTNEFSLSVGLSFQGINSLNSISWFLFKY